MKIVVLEGFVAVWGSPEAPRGMPEAVAVDPESIIPNGGMATPFSPDLTFVGPGFGLAKALETGGRKIKSGLNGAARPRHGLRLIPLSPGGLSPASGQPPGPKRVPKSLKSSDFLNFRCGSAKGNLRLSVVV